MSRTIRGVIWDVDGTLINSNDAHAHAWVEALEHFDIQVAFRTVRPLMGMGGDKLLPAIAGIESNSRIGKEVGKRRAELFKTRYLPHLTAFPRTRELLLRMRSKGLALAVASSSKKDELDLLLALANVKDLIEDATSSSDAEHSKPDPDIVQVALHRLQLEPSHAVMIGDTCYDIEAARRLDIATIALRCGGSSDHTLADAVAIYDDPADLLAQLDASLLATA